MEWYDQDERFNPLLKYRSANQLRTEGGYRAYVPDPESHCVWILMEDGQLASIPDEETAVDLAETFPETICFFADSVPHPNS